MRSLIKHKDPETKAKDQSPSAMASKMDPVLRWADATWARFIGFFIGIHLFIRGLIAKYHAKRARKRAEGEAYKRFLQEMGIDPSRKTSLFGSRSERKAERAIRKTARDMAKRAPLSTHLSPSTESLFTDQEPDIRPYVPEDPSEEDAYSGKGHSYFEELGVRIEDDDSTFFGAIERKGTSSNLTTTHGARSQRALKSVITPKPKDKALSTLSFTDEEENIIKFLHESGFEDVYTAPTPQKSDVKKVDLSARGYWESNPNATEEIQLASRMPIVHNQIRTIIEHLLTSRPSIQGPPELIEPIRRWFEVEMELATEHQRGLDRFIEDTVKQMLYFGSAAVIKQRTLSKTIKPFKHPVKDAWRAPVWGYAVPDMTTMEVFVDTKGRARKWRQKPYLYSDGEAKEYRQEDVFIARLPTQNSSLYFWTPSYVLPALYAVNVLGDLHKLIESHTQAIVDIRYYVQVGSENYLDGRVTRPMVEKTGRTLDTTGRGGTPVVPWFVKLEKLDLDEYIEQLSSAASFWEQEIRRGIGGSLLQDGVGDSATRNTSDALVEKEMRAAQALVPELQRAFRWLIIDKMWELGIKPESIRSWEDIPSLVFEEIDHHQQIRRETHFLQLWQNDLLKHGEVRKAIGRDEDLERADLYHSDLELETTTEEIDAEAEAQVYVAKNSPQPTNGTVSSSGKTKTKNTKKKKVTASQTTPNGSPRPRRPNR